MQKEKHKLHEFQDKCGCQNHGQIFYYAPNFKEVGRLYCFGLVHPSVHSSVCHTFLVSKITKKPLKLGL